MFRSEVRLWRTCLGLTASASMLCGPARAQYVETYLPAGVPGFDRNQGVPVITHAQPLPQEPTVRLGSFVFRGGLDENLGYDSNITGNSQPIRSSFIESNASASAASDWSRNRLTLSTNVDNYTYLSAPREDYTNYNVSIGGGYTILRSELSVGYSHQQAHELGTDVGAVPSSVPVPYNLDVIRGDYTMESGRFQFTPNVDFRSYSFGNAIISGQPTSQQYRDRTVLSGGITTRYALSDQRGILAVVQGNNSHYLVPGAGMPSLNSKSVLLLVGLDYQASGPWRYRVLAGVESRQFASAQYGTRTAPVFEGSVIYTPSRLTTITGLVRREIEDPQSESSSGYLYTTVALVIDHEYRRNIFLQANGSFQNVDYFQNGGSSNDYTIGASVNWLLNRRVRLSASYDYTRQISSSNQTVAAMQPGTQGLPSYTRNVVLLGVHFGL